MKRPLLYSLASNLSSFLTREHIHDLVFVIQQYLQGMYFHASQRIIYDCSPTATRQRVNLSGLCHAAGGALFPLLSHNRYFSCRRGRMSLIVLLFPAVRDVAFSCFERRKRRDAGSKKRVASSHHFAERRTKRQASTSIT